MMIHLKSTDSPPPGPSLRRASRHGLEGAAHPTPRHAPKFGGMVESLDRFIGFVTRNVYDKGEGWRYAFEQTIGYTIPRTAQQLNRTRHITGKENTMAAKEMLFRDLAADFADTFLPGLLATLGIGFVADKLAGTFVRLNLGRKAIGFYHQVAHPSEKGWASKAAFYETLEQRLKASALADTQKAVPHALGLADLVEKLPTKWWGRQKVMTEAAQTLAERLGLPHLDVKLSAGDHELAMALPELVRDLFHFNRHPKLGTLAGQEWGQEMARLLSKTARLSKVQMVANVVALVASISIPFAIRLMTRHSYGGRDAFPGTEALKEHFSSNPQQKVFHHHLSPDERKFVLFPYLKKSLKAGNWVPTVITAGFFGLLAAVVARRFKINNAGFNWKDILRVYEFKKGFPWTTDVQMELTYGLLCGIRLASSRDESEFRETTIRDCALGWPTLTYFFPWFRKVLSGKFNGALTRQYGNGSLLMKAKDEVRSGDEMKTFFFKNLGVQNPEAAMAGTKKYQSRISFVAGLTSWFLLAFLEPKVGIWLTNHMELEKLKKEGKVKDVAAAPMPIVSNPFRAPAPAISVSMPPVVAAPVQAFGPAFPQRRPNGSATMTFPESFAPSARAFAFAPGQ